MSKTDELLKDHAKYGVRETLCIGAVAAQLADGFTTRTDVIRAMTTDARVSKIMARLELAIPRKVLVTLGFMLISSKVDGGEALPPEAGDMLAELSKVCSDEAIAENLERLNTPLTAEEEARLDELLDTTPATEPDATGFSLAPKKFKTIKGGLLN